MADPILKTLPELTAASTPSGTDLLAIYQGTSPLKKITWSNFLEAIVAELGVLVDSAGNPFNPDSHPQTFAYNASGNVSAITATDGVTTWVQTFTYGADGVATVSNWVVQ